MFHPIKHFKTITTHRHMVMQECFRVGLYRQGLLHDLSKYSPTEFIVGARYWQGNRSPNNAEREDTGLSTAWLHHKGRNKHHYEYWIDYVRKDGQIELAGMKMPVNYVVEMCMDRIAACKVYNGDAYTQKDPLAYYQKGNPSRFMHPDTSALLEKLLVMLAEEGEEALYSYIKTVVLPQWRRDRRKKRH
ncbi:MAG: catalase [Lachnospiraceae bacterium]|nr:catalase [Lachnospiraceae bacterium]